MRLVNWIMVACFATASFDIFLVFNVAGNVRFCQLMLALICAAAVARIVQDGRILWPRGGSALILWLSTQVLFLPVAPMLSVALQFLAVITFTIVSYFAVLQLYGRSNLIGSLFRSYLWSFIFVAIFGLYQFFYSAAGGTPLLVRQWAGDHRVARINGFSFEPSFFATYMMMGWIMLVDLRINHAQLTSGTKWKWLTILVTVTLILCTSKTGWALMLLELGLRIGAPALRGLRNMARRWTQGLLLIRIPRRRVLVNVSAVLLIVTGGAFYLFTHIDPWSLLQGTGLGNTAAHSSLDRWNETILTWEVFLEHPFIGYTLGGVPFAIAQHTGQAIHKFDDVRLFWGFPVFLDVLAASGIFGFIPFCYFLWVNTRVAFKIARVYAPSEEARWLRALARALVFELLMLLADQNLLRVYFWLQLTMVTLVAYHLEYGREPVHAEDAHAPFPLGAEASA